MAVALVHAGPLAAQNILDEFSYEGLGFTGVGADFGWAASDRLASDVSGSLRIEYGEFAPRVRLLFGASLFRSSFDADEIDRFETRLRQLVDDPTDDFDITVGEIVWTDVSFEADLQYMFRGRSRLTPFAGVGIGVHWRNGSGEAVSGTFVEDALDTVAAGLNVSSGFELALASGLAFYGDLRLALSSELNVASVRGGFMLRPFASR